MGASLRQQLLFSTSRSVPDDSGRLLLRPDRHNVHDKAVKGRLTWLF